MKNKIKPESAKSDRFAAAAEAVFGILQRHGEDQVSHTRVARDSGISRSWLYKYAGKTPGDLINLTIDHFGKVFIDHGPAQTSLTRDEWKKVLVERFGAMLDSTFRYPGIPRVYFKYRAFPGPVGRWLEEMAWQIRNRETTELQAVFGLKKLEAERISEILSALRMGLMFGMAPAPLPDFALSRNLSHIQRDEAMELFARILAGVVP